MEKNTVMRDNKQFSEIAKKQLKFYLAEFWVKPSKDAKIIDFAKTFVTESNYAVSVLLSSDLELRQLAQRIILAYSRSVYWEVVSSYMLVEKFIASEPVQSIYSEPELLFITYTGKEPPNRMLVPMTNGLIALRSSKNLKTVLLALKPNMEFIPNPMPLPSTITAITGEVDLI